MARGNDTASGAATSAQNISSTAAGNAGALYGTLAPQLEAEAAHPAGFAPADLAAMDTSVQQSAGGTQAAATGAGGLMAARTRNAGAPMAAVAKAARTGGEIASEGALGTQIKNAGLEESQRQAANSELGNLYGVNQGSSVNALGQVAGNINADTNAENASWDWTKGLEGIGSFLGWSAQAYKGMK